MEEARCCCLRAALQDSPKAVSCVPLLGLWHPDWRVPSLALGLWEDLGCVSLSVCVPWDQHKGRG